jgi:predicted MFS family arabinose efflux permease
MKKLQLHLVILSACVLVLTALLLSWFALQRFKQGLSPEMTRTVTTVSYSASQVMEKAHDHGVPLDAMVGVEAFLNSVRKDNPNIVYMVVSDAQGRALYQSGLPAAEQTPGMQDAIGMAATDVKTVRAGDYLNTSVPLVFGSSRVGTLHLGQQAAFVEQQMQEIAFDVITVLVVGSLIALELMRFVLTFAITTPGDVMRAFLTRAREGDFSSYLPHDSLGGIGQLSARFNHLIANINQRYHALLAHPALGGTSPAGLQQRLAEFRFHAPGEHTTLYSAALAHIRWPFFLLIFADSLSLSFFPVFVGQFYSPDMGLSRTLVVGLPISIFMFTWALSMPWAGMWSDRVGHRKAFMVGAAVTTAGLVLTAFAQSLYDLLLWRSLTALGYGLVFITAQSYVTNNTPPAQRTRGMAVFLSSFFAGSLSGSAIGGILSDRLGYEHTILLSGLLSAASALFVLRFLHTQSNSTAAAKKKLSVNDFKLLLRNKKFVAITFLAAVPAKIALTGFLYYSVPLYLKLLGNNQSTTGRVMMAYGLAIIILSPFAAKLADRIGQLRWFVTVGGYAATLSMFIIYSFDNMAGLLCSITLLGVAHAIGVSPQLALINDFCKDVVQEVGSGTATGIFRLIERLGNVLGPIIAGIFIAQFGFKGAFLGIGILSFVCISCFTFMFFWFDRQSRAVAVAG